MLCTAHVWREGVCGVGAASILALCTSLGHRWLSALNLAIEECRERGLKCGKLVLQLVLYLYDSVAVCSEYFGTERVMSGDEDKKHEDKEWDSGDESKVPSSTGLSVLPSKSDPE